MPILQKFRDNHFEASQKVSQLVQTLSLSGLAVVWLFHNKNNGIYGIPKDLFSPLFLFLLCLFIDFIQHFFKTAIWHFIYLYYERNLEVNKKNEKQHEVITENSELYAPNVVNYIPYLLFYSKSIILGFSYFLLLKFVWKSISFA